MSIETEQYEKAKKQIQLLSFIMDRPLRQLPRLIGKNLQRIKTKDAAKTFEYQGRIYQNGFQTHSLEMFE